MAKWLKKLWFVLSGGRSWKKCFNYACNKFQEGDLDAAREGFQTALMLAEQANHRGSLFTTLVCMGSFMRSIDNFVESEVALTRAVKELPSDCALEDQGYLFKELGICRYEAGKPDLAEEPLEQALQVYSKTAAAPELAECYLYIAKARILQCKFEQALEPLAKSLSVHEHGPEERHRVADALRCETLVRNRLEQFEQAEVLSAKAIALHEELYGKESVETARCVLERAGAILAQSRPAEAQELLLQAVGFLEVTGKYPVEQADLLTALGSCYRKQHLYNDAVACYSKALHLYENQQDSDIADIAGALTHLAVCYSEQEDYTRAECFFRRALKVTDSSDRPDRHSRCDSIYNIAKCCAFQERYHEAIDLYRQALAIVEQDFGPDHVKAALLLTEIAYCHQVQEQTRQALPLYERAQAIYDKQESVKPEDDEIADNLIGLANCYVETGELSKACQLYHRALEHKQFKFDPRDQDLVSRIEELLKHLESAAASPT